MMASRLGFHVAFSRIEVRLNTDIVKGQFLPDRSARLVRGFPVGNSQLGRCGHCAKHLAVIGYPEVVSPIELLVAVPGRSAGENLAEGCWMHLLDPFDPNQRLVLL